MPIENKEKAKVVRKKVACKDCGFLKMIAHDFRLLAKSADSSVQPM